jgi:hypothetical protein
MRPLVSSEIESLTVNQLTAGTITAQEIVLATGDDGMSIIRSENFVTGVSGWQVDSDGDAEFNDVLVRGDVYGNWDGTIPADLSAVDSGATTGYYLDSSEGALQAMGDMWLGGDMTLIGSGQIATAVSGGDRVTLDSSGLKAVLADGSVVGIVKPLDPGIIFRGSDDVHASGIQITDTSGANSIIIKQRTGAGSSASAIFIGNQTINIPNFPLVIADGSAGAPSLGFWADPDTGIYRIGADNLGISVGGSLRLAFNADVEVMAAAFEVPVYIRPGVTTIGPTLHALYRPSEGIVIASTSSNGEMGAYRQTTSTTQAVWAIYSNVGATRRRHAYFQSDGRVVLNSFGSAPGTGLFVQRNFTAIGDVQVLRGVFNSSPTAAGTEVGYHSSLEAHKDNIHSLTDELGSALSIIAKVRPSVSDRKPEFAGGDEMIQSMLDERKAQNRERGIKGKADKNSPLRTTGPNGVLHEVGFIHENLMEAHPQLITRDGASPSDRALLALAYAGIQELEARLAILEAA